MTLRQSLLLRSAEFKGLAWRAAYVVNRGMFGVVYRMLHAFCINLREFWSVLIEKSISVAVDLSDPWQLTLVGTAVLIIETRVRDIIRGNNHKPDDGSNPPEDKRGRERGKKGDVNLEERDGERNVFLDCC